MNLWCRNLHIIPALLQTRKLSYNHSYNLISIFDKCFSSSTKRMKCNQDKKVYIYYVIVWWWCEHNIFFASVSKKILRCCRWRDPLRYQSWQFLLNSAHARAEKLIFKLRLVIGPDLALGRPTGPRLGLFTSNFVVLYRKENTYDKECSLLDIGSCQSRSHLQILKSFEKLR